MFVFTTFSDWFLVIWIKVFSMDSGLNIRSWEVNATSQWKMQRWAHWKLSFSYINWKVSYMQDMYIFPIEAVKQEGWYRESQLNCRRNTLAKFNTEARTGEVKSQIHLVNYWSLTRRILRVDNFIGAT